MSITRESILVELICEISTVLQPQVPISPQQRRLLAERIIESELDKDDNVPGWLVDLLTAVRNLQLTGDWVDFTRSCLDDTSLFDFIRDLPQLLPVEFKNNEESWMLTFHGVNIEVCISLEGSCYKVSQIGKTWD